MSFNYDFRRINSRAALLTVLGVDETQFKRIIDFQPPPPAWLRPPTPEPQFGVLDIPAFIRHDIPKKNISRGHRTVWDPVLTASNYKALARRLDNFFGLVGRGYPHECTFGYRSGRNIKENALRHCGHKFLLVADIEDFFPSISRSAISNMFYTLGVCDEVADLVSRFLTIGDKLPLGLPTSPVVSNMVALPIDNALQAVAVAIGATYTRYSDDLSFSSNGNLPDTAVVRNVLADFGFRLAESKTRRSTYGQSHYVTGLSISDSLQPHVPRNKKQRLRQEIYFAGKFGLADHLRHVGVNDSKVVQQEVNRLDGLIKFVAHHEPRKAVALKESWRTILKNSDMKPSFTPRGTHRSPYYLFIDEAEFKRGDKNILALCITMTQHPEKIVDDTKRVLRNALNDLWVDGNINTLQRRGLHFTDATQDIRLAYVKELAAMPFEGYVAYREYDKSSDYEDTYLSLLRLMVTRRLMAAESQCAHFLFEQNSKVSTSKIKSCVDIARTELKETDNRRPAAVQIDFIAKPNPVLSPPDFLLGVLGQYLNAKPQMVNTAIARERLMFERLRDKYRLILDASNGIEYSRRRPIVPWCEVE